MSHTSYRVQAGDPGTALVRIQGPLTAHTARGLYDELSRLAQAQDVRAVRLDFSEVAEFDSPAAAALSTAFEQLQEAGKTAELEHASARHQLIFGLLPPLPPAPPRGPVAREPRAGRAGAIALELMELVLSLFASAAQILVGKQRLHASAVADQALRLGVSAVYIVGLLNFLTGLILAFQSVYQLQRFGAAIFMAQIVSLGMVREFAALMTAIILAGRSSSAIAAELGTMAVRDEIAALRVIGVDIVSFLVLPRLLAVLLVQPALTVLAMALGIGGGLLVAQLLGLPMGAVYHRMQEALTAYDFSLGLFKSVLFACIVGLTGCFLGLSTRGGASSVGKNTTRAVVSAIFLIVVVDSLVTTSWTMAGYGER